MPRPDGRRPKVPLPTLLLWILAATVAVAIVVRLVADRL
jgi:hypothetical protein